MGNEHYSGQVFALWVCESKPATYDWYQSAFQTEACCGSGDQGLQACRGSSRRHGLITCPPHMGAIVQCNVAPSPTFSFLLQCIASQELKPLHPQYMIYTRADQQAKFKQQLDPYEDSYTDTATPEFLKGVFAKMNMSSAIAPAGSIDADCSLMDCAEGAVLLS